MPILFLKGKRDKTYEPLFSESNPSLVFSFVLICDGSISNISPHLNPSFVRCSGSLKTAVTPFVPKIDFFLYSLPTKYQNKTSVLHEIQTYLYYSDYPKSDLEKSSVTSHDLPLASHNLPLTFHDPQ